MNDYSKWPGIIRYGGINGHQIPFVLKIAPVIQSSINKGILNSIRLSQAILESNWGTSRLSIEANNLFGIKADSRWKGPTYNIQTKEWNESGFYSTTSDFRAYKTIEDSVLDHTEFLLTNQRYSSIIGDTDYKSTALKLKAAGYATDPEYGNKLISVIEVNSLTWFDNTEEVPKQLLEVGTRVRIKPGAVWMTTPPKPISSWVFLNDHVIDELKGIRAVLDKKGLCSPIDIKYLEPV
jgi:hypothetical protein